MFGPQPMHRAWILGLLPDQVQIRCAYKRLGKRLTQYTVQLEIYHQGSWQPVVRYDNAHGFCHCDTIHPDGTQDKTPLFIGDANETFTAAIKELRAHWVTHRDRYLKEIKP
jgi:hypothetical protein